MFINSSNWVGMGNTGCDTGYCYSWIPYTYAHQSLDYTHEMGHNINLAHSGFAPETGQTGNNLEYGDVSKPWSETLLYIFMPPEANEENLNLRCYGRSLAPWDIVAKSVATMPHMRTNLAG